MHYEGEVAQIELVRIYQRFLGINNHMYDYSFYMLKKILHKL